MKPHLKLSLLLLPLLFAGCATESMKSTPYYTGHDVTYTGNAEDRVNLWPLAYWRAPVGSVLWPMFSFSDDHFAFRPLYSQWKRGGEWNEFNILWPICQFDTRRDDHRIFPFIWGDGYFHVFPFLWNCDRTHVLFPIVWYDRDESFDLFPILFWNWRRDRFTLFPLYWHRPDVECLFPIFYHDTDTTLVTPFVGWNRRGDSWVFPLYASVGEDFLSIPWCSGKDYWAVPPLLTWGDASSMHILGCLAGYTATEKGYSSSWLFPFYYHSSDGCLVTPLYGQNGDSRWLFPLFYNDSEDFVSPLLCHFNAGKEDSSWFIPPLLTTWCEDGFASPLWIRDEYNNNIIPWLLSGYSDDGRGGFCLLGLGGWSHGTSWAFPIYYRNARNGDIRTLLAGRITDRENTYHWWLTPLVGTKSGAVSGGWFFPLVDVTLDREVAELEKFMYADTLDASVTGSYRDRVRYVGEGVYETNRVFSVRTRSASNETSFLFGLGGCERNLHLENNDENRLGWGDSVQKMAGDKRRRTKESGKTVSFTDSADIGNIFLFKRKSERAVSFDYDTKEKIFEGRVSSTGIFCHLLWHAKREVVEGSHDYSEASILWRLWHRESLNGDTTTDVFPFITIDNRKNGFTKTSFLWRFFRYEKDPEKGTKIDFLFLPIWR